MADGTVKVNGITYTVAQWNALTQSAPSNTVDYSGLGQDNALSAGVDSLRAATDRLTKGVKPGEWDGSAVASDAQLQQGAKDVAAKKAGQSIDWSGWFVRGVVVILGFVFVAVGLGMFRVPGVVIRQ